MNVLLLTPDRVGSTLLQRTLTIYMLRKGFDKPVINLHELSNGLEKVYNPILNREVLSKPKGTQWGYYQTLPEVLDLLQGSDHYITSRLAHYHLQRRNDPTADRLKFFDYLNNNFYIISCRRKNLFEHALSWVIQAHSKVLNVYSIESKINTFYDIYKNGVVATKERVDTVLDRYLSYIQWTDTQFDVQSYFNYEDSINDLESYILGLDFMTDAKDNTWNDMFGMTFDTWNKCHKTLPDLFFLEGKNYKPTEALGFSDVSNTIREQDWNKIKGEDWPTYQEVSGHSVHKVLENVPATVASEIRSAIKLVSVLDGNFQSKEMFDFLKTNIEPYTAVSGQIAKLVDSGFLVTGVPIKLQTFKEKQRVIKNFDQVVEWYNSWVDRNGYGEPYKENETQVLLEEQKLNSFQPGTNLISK